MQHSTVRVYIVHSLHVRHLHLSRCAANTHLEGSIRKPRYSQLSPQISIPRAPTEYYNPVVCFAAAQDHRRSIHLPTPTISSSAIISQSVSHTAASQSVCQSVSPREASPASQSIQSPSINQVHSSTLLKICIKVPRLISPSCSPQPSPSCAIPARPVSSHLLCTGLLFKVIPCDQPLPRLAPGLGLSCPHSLICARRNKKVEPRRPSDLIDSESPRPGT